LSGALQVVGTLRPEFLDQLLLSPELAGVHTRTYTVRPLPREALAAVIEQPARLAGIGVDPDLVTRLVTDTDGGEALPLLAYTLAQLAEGVDRGGRLLLSRYEQLGGVRGTLTRQADAALDTAASVSGRSREQIVRGLLQLVTVDEHGRPTRWRVPTAELPVAELEPFVTRRLLTIDSDNDGAVMEVAHEAIMSAWPPLAKAVQANSVALRARREVEQAADEWCEAGRPPIRLWERGQLAAAVADLDVRSGLPEPALPGSSGTGSRKRPWWRRRQLIAERVALSPDALQFLRASLRRDRGRRARSTTILASLLVLALAAAGVALIQLQDAARQQRIATSRLLMTQAEATIARNPRVALQIAEAAEHLNPDPETRSARRHAGRAGRPAELAVVEGVMGLFEWPPSSAALGTQAPSTATAPRCGTWPSPGTAPPWPPPARTPPSSSGTSPTRPIRSAAAHRWPGTPGPSARLPSPPTAPPWPPPEQTGRCSSGMSATRRAHTGSGSPSLATPVR
jgi:hypothetical protein